MQVRPKLFTTCASALLAALTPTASLAQLTPAGPQPLSWYLPDDVEYDASFPVPSSVLGWDVGTWHVRHDQLVRWYEHVAEASPRVQLETYAHSHEQRPLLLATVSSPANLARLDELREAHVRAVLSGAEAHDGPAVVWMGYSVHGNEPSGSNAALLLAYHLAAAQGEAVEAFLRDTIVLIDPCINPDGLARFAHWANMHRGQSLVGDPAHREHREVWPGGRTNHYWFDLNRDWLLLTHPESQGRLARFHAWMPSVVTDFHEMGSNSTYFFQPGIPSRQNPLTPLRNLELTRAIAAYHAESLDEIGSLYYTEESFDDFYYGKGSTYPDLQGSVGILFEQASSRGHFQENDFGGISFPFSIRNQLRTSLSTLRGAHELRDELGSYSREFFATALSEADQHPVRAYVFAAPEDPERTWRLVELLDQHGIHVHALGRELELEGVRYEPGSAFVVPLQQAQFRLIRALFETRTSWEDNTFYDVSSWSLPLSFDVPTRALDVEQYDDGLLGAAWSRRPERGSIEAGERPVAWLFEWHHYNAPRALQSLLAAGVRARVATRRFSVQTGTGPRAFDYGTIVVPPGIQDVTAAELRVLVEQVAAMGLEVHGARSGLTYEGVDLGSGSLRTLEEPHALMLVGSPISAYEAGEVWHYLDTRVGLPVSMVERDSFGRVDLERYTHLLLVAGASSGWGESDVARVRDWVRGGGVVVATKSSAMWAANELLSNAEEEEEQDEEDEEGEEQAEEEPPSVYLDYEDLRAVQSIAGTIFEARMDRTHPMCFGYVRDELTLFRNHTSILPEAEDPFATPLRYSEEPLVSGFASEENIELIAGSPAVRAARLGRGSVVCILDNPNFRGVWYGTNRLYSNAIYFGPAIKTTGKIEVGEGRAADGHEH